MGSWRNWLAQLAYTQEVTGSSPVEPTMVKTGYKEMLRDRCPIVVDWALKWCKAKTRWIDHCYEKFIKIYKSNDERHEATRICLGISGKYRNFDFHKTVDWDNLTEDETKYWNYVESWVKWFRKTMLFIEEEYKFSREKGMSDFDIKVKLINTFLRSFLPADTDSEETKESKYKLVDNLVDYITECLRNDYV